MTSEKKIFKFQKYETYTEQRLKEVARQDINIQLQYIQRLQIHDMNKKEVGILIKNTFAIRTAMESEKQKQFHKMILAMGQCKRSQLGFYPSSIRTELKKSFRSFKRSIQNYKLPQLPSVELVFDCWPFSNRTHQKLTKINKQYQPQQKFENMLMKQQALQSQSLLQLSKLEDAVNSKNQFMEKKI